nr:histone deacetylase [Micromonospora sp. DSM 115978]
TDLDLSEVLATGRAQLGLGRYETLVLAGYLDDLPLLTFTAPWRLVDVSPAAPSAAYLARLAAGLREAHGWPAARTSRYLAALPGALGTLRPDDDRRVVATCYPAPTTPTPAPAPAPATMPESDPISDTESN